MKDIEKIKAYWMATMDMGEGREWWEQEVWNTTEGMQILMNWFDIELELGLTEEEMDRVIEEAGQ